MPSLAADPVTDGAVHTWSHDWIVEAGSPDARPVVHDAAERSSLMRSEDGRIVVLFAGLLTNARELEAGAHPHSAADIVRRAFAGDVRTVANRLRGPFALFIYERDARRLWVGRDQVGQQPLYVARRGSAWLFSGSPHVLDRLPGVASGPDPVALSEYLCGWYPSVASTGYRGVERVAPATLIRIEDGREHAERYWDPWPEDEPIEWLSSRQLDGFDDVFQRAVARSTGAGPAAVFLSGGLDSIAVAAAARDDCVKRGEAAPRALSLAFPGAAANEETVQRGVAARLGLDQTLTSLDEAAGPAGLVAAALTMAGEWPVPMWNIWAPAYEHLGRLARQQGSASILTGRGGDEWLTITPYLAADLVRAGDVAGLHRLLAMRRRSQNLHGLGAHARLLWLTAGRPLASAALDAIAPRLWQSRRRARLLAERPSWVAPDPQVRAAMDGRVEGWMTPARPRQGFYVREMRTALLHPAITQDLEETQEFGRRLGLHVLHPFWDVDVIELLYRAPPHLLMADGRSKSLLRRQLSDRLPGLGLERRGKVTAGGVFRNLVQREATAAWTRLGGMRALGKLGIVNSSGVQSVLPAALEAGPTRHTGRVWELLTLETWVRERFGVV
jgi:asparagine synthase (glutamine-hydrolysing)